MSKAKGHEEIWQRLQAERESGAAIRLALEYGGAYVAATPDRRPYIRSRQHWPRWRHLTSRCPTSRRRLTR